MKRLFFGGVHPRDKKEMSVHTAPPLPITPAQVIIPLHQHIGVPCTPLVKVGDHVLRGQKIGDGEGLCVPVHASVSGTVTAIEPRPHPNGMTVTSIVIENDFRGESLPFVGCDLSGEHPDADAILHAIREAGIVGMGGAAFPGNIKALTSLGKVDTIIANGCECEPYITSDDTLLRTDPEAVLEGMMILCRLLTPERIVLAIENNKTDAIQALLAFREQYPLIEIAVLPTRYPQGGEKQLVQAITGREIPPNSLPANIGCVVFNVSTFAAISRAVKEGAPLTERIVTVTGEGIVNPQNFLVPIGTPFFDVIEAAGGLKEDTDRVISGGPMMGTAQEDLSVPVVKATNSVLCLSRDARAPKESVCIRCGKCLTVCPMHLQPLYICRYAKAENTKELAHLNVTDCMECGCCSYICPAKLPLVEGCRKGKKLLKEAKEA